MVRPHDFYEKEDKIHDETDDLYRKDKSTPKKIKKEDKNKDKNKKRKILNT